MHVQDKFIMAGTSGTPHLGPIGIDAGKGARMWSYTRMPHSVGGHHQRWRSVRVLAPVLPRQRWMAARGKPALCCGSALERPHSTEVHVYLKECPAS